MEMAARAASMPRLNFGSRQRIFACASSLHESTSWMIGMRVGERELLEGVRHGAADEFGVVGVALDDDAEGDESRRSRSAALVASSWTTMGISNAPGT